MRIVAVLAALVAAPAASDACSCIEPPPPDVALQRAGAVFEGQVIAGVPSEDGRLVNVGFRVSQRWKGPADETISVSTPSQPATCGFTFESGKTYLVYADSMNGSLVATLCSRTRPIEMAGEDVLALGAPLEAPAGDPVATRPAPAMLEPRGPVQPSDGGGCACSSKTHAELSSAEMVPFALFGLRSIRRRRSKSSL